MSGFREPYWIRDALARTGTRRPVHWLRGLRRRTYERRELDGLVTDFQESMWFQQDRSRLLHQLFDQYGSDKGSAVGASPFFPWPPHTYADVYATLFEHCRYSLSAIFECGIGTNRTEFLSNMSTQGRPGASLRAWRDYFPNAQIIGADVDASVLFQEDRIRTFFVDQTDASSIREMWERAGAPELDLIVDDGLHSLHAAATLFEGSWRLLRDGGIYIIEDIQLHNLASYRRLFDQSSAWVTYVVVPRKPDADIGDNCLLILRKCLPQEGRVE